MALPSWRPSYAPQKTHGPFRIAGGGNTRGDRATGPPTGRKPRLLPQQTLSERRPWCVQHARHYQARECPSSGVGKRDKRSLRGNSIGNAANSQVCIHSGASLGVIRSNCFSSDPSYSTDRGRPCSSGALTGSCLRTTQSNENCEKETKPNCNLEGFGTQVSARMARNLGPVSVEWGCSHPNRLSEGEGYETARSRQFVAPLPSGRGSENVGRVGPLVYTRGSEKLGDVRPPSLPVGVRKVRHPRGQCRELRSEISQ